MPNFEVEIGKLARRVPFSKMYIRCSVVLTISSGVFATALAAARNAQRKGYFIEGAAPYRKVCAMGMLPIRDATFWSYQLESRAVPREPWFVEARGRCKSRNDSRLGERELGKDPRSLRSLWGGRIFCTVDVFLENTDHW